MIKLLLIKGCAILLIAASLPALGKSTKNNGENTIGTTSNCLVVGFDKNYHSNYYPDVMIASKIGIDVNHLDTLFNNLFITKLLTQKSKRYKYLSPENDNEFSILKENIHYVGETDDRYPELSSVSLQSFQTLLNKFGSDYLIVFSQYYMKKQEKPFPTLFHIINYSVYNHSKEEIMKGKVFSNSFDLVNLQELEKIFQKNALKNMAAIEKGFE